MWSSIPEFPGYLIDPETQEVRGRRGGILKRRPDKRGRIWIALYRDGKQYSLKLAHLMLITFDRQPGPGEVSRHFDDDPRNNDLSNLCWGTQSENMHDKVRNGLHWNANKTECNQGHPFDEANTRIDKLGKRNCRTCARDRARERRRVA